MATGRLICRLRSMSLRMLLAMAASAPLHGQVACDLRPGAVRLVSVFWH